MADTSIYSRLKRLFSTNVIVRHVGGKRLKIADMDSIQGFMSNAVRDRYAKIHASSGYATSGTQYGVNMAYQTQRIMLFRDYDVMDNDPILASALDIYADECTVFNEYGEILTITSDNQQIKDVLHNLFYDILNIEFNLWPWMRNLVKYGDFFLFLEISPQYGIINVMPLSVYDTLRVEGEKPENPYYVYFETLGANGYKQTFENYEMAHFRLMSDSNFLPYGKSMLENARRTFRQLILMEDAMLIHRIMRAPEKRIFKIDVGNIPPAEIDIYLQRLADKTKKIPYQDPLTGDYNLRYNMQNLLQDFYIPIRAGDGGTSIENLGGLEYNAIDDIEYLRNKMMAGLKIPKAFLGYDENVAGKSTLAALDVRFARTIERIQRLVNQELKKIAMVHLFAQGYQDEDLVNFDLKLTTPSTVYQQEKVNLWMQKIELATAAMETKLFSSNWIYENVFEMREEEYEEERALVVEDEKRKFRLMMIEQGASDPAKFGFPQDAPNQMGTGGAGGPGAPGGAAGGPPGAAPGGAPAANMPKSIDDLPTLADLQAGGSKQTENESTAGAPRKGEVYAQDSHVRGRDPLGFKELYRSRQLTPLRKDKPKFSLPMENRGMSGALKYDSPIMSLMSDKLIELNKKNRPLLANPSGPLIAESKNDDAGTMLDESKLDKVDQIVDNLSDDPQK